MELGEGWVTLMHVSVDSLNVNEKRLVEPLLDKVLGEDIEVELVVTDSQHKSGGIFSLLESLGVGNLVP